MRAAMEAGTKIPKLCATDMLNAFGSCRMCLVEIEGRGRHAGLLHHAGRRRAWSSRRRPSGWRRIRKGVMELYISDHPLDCLTARRTATASCRTWRARSACASALRLRRREPRLRQGQRLAERSTGMPKDESNPYFTYDPSKCIVCSRCVRACEEVQGTFALTIEGRGFDSRVSPGMMEPFLDSECVSCGACVQACPTATLHREIRASRSASRSIRSSRPAPIAASAAPSRRRCAATTVVRMVPYKDGKANEGHSCVKGRFAWGYATHKDRITKPMIRAKTTDPWREVTWDEAINHAASEFKRIQATYGRDSIGGITSSRCTNEETYLVQKLVRAAFSNNNVDTCARVCHSPTGYGLKATFGTSAGTQDFDSVDKSDVIVVIGANPTDAHPVFASRMKKRLREGARLIVIDPRKIDLVETPHVQRRLSPAAHARHQRRGHQCDRACRRHRRADRRRLRARALRAGRFPGLGALHRRGAEFAGSDGEDHRRSGGGRSRRGAALRDRRQRRDLLRPRRHRAQPGLDHGHGHGEPRDGDRQYRPRRRRRESAARPEQRAGRLRHGLVPARASRLPPRLRRRDAHRVRGALGHEALERAGPAHPEHARRGGRWRLQGHLHPGRGHRAVRSRHAARDRRPRGDGMRRRAGPLPERDGEIRARLPAGLVVPGEGRHLHQRRAPHQPASAR